MAQTTKPKDPMPFSVTYGSIVKVLVVLLVAFALWKIHGIILVILVSVVIATFIDNGTELFAKIKIPRSLSVILMYVIGVGLFALAFYAFIPVLIDELIALVKLLPQESGVAQFFSFLGEGTLRESISNFSNVEDPLMVVNDIRGSLSAGGIFQTASSIFGGIANLILVFVISFYLSMQKDGVEQFLGIITPAQHKERVIGIWQRSKRKIGGWFKGQMMLAIILAILTYVGLTLIGVPYALILSLIAMLFSLIPFGIVLGTIPAIIIGFLSGGFTTALLVVGLYTLLQQFENHIFQPLVMRRVTGVPSLIVLISVIIGAKLAGFLGLILAIPVSVVILEIIHEAEANKLATVKKTE